MLVLKRKLNESIELHLPGGEKVVVTVARLCTDLAVKIGIDAPASVEVYRSEIPVEKRRSHLPPTPDAIDALCTYRGWTLRPVRVLAVASDKTLHRVVMTCPGGQEQTPSAWFYGADRAMASARAEIDRIIEDACIDAMSVQGHEQESGHADALI